MKMIMVTGGAGYIGSVCVEQLLNAGYNVAVFDNLSEGHRLAIDTRATFFQGDLSDIEAIKLALRESKAEAVMHFAANALVGESMTNPGKYFRNNVANGVNLLEAMVAEGVKRFVFSSTCATFGIPESMPINETLPQKPINPYGESKLMFEKVLRWYGELHGITFVALRYFNAAGATEQFGEDHRIETILSRTSSRLRWARRSRSRSTAPTTRHRTAVVSGTTSTSSISRRPTCSHSRPRRAPSTTSAPAAAPP